MYNLPLRSYKINAMHSIEKMSGIQGCSGMLRAAQGLSEMPQVYSGLLRSAQGCPRFAQVCSGLPRDAPGLLRSAQRYSRIPQGHLGNLKVCQEISQRSPGNPDTSGDPSCLICLGHLGFFGLFFKCPPKGHQGESSFQQGP